jgi:hypothetical protein
MSSPSANAPSTHPRMIASLLSWPPPPLPPPLFDCSSAADCVLAAAAAVEDAAAVIDPVELCNVEDKAAEVELAIVEVSPAEVSALEEALDDELGVAVVRGELAVRVMLLSMDVTWV